MNYSKSFRIDHGKRFRLRDYDPADTGGLQSPDEARQILHEGVAKLTELQDLLYAQDRWALLIILQAMDAAGKDGTIKHVMSGVNPEGCQVHSFKSPSDEELHHDFMWRCWTRLPGRGQIGIFNRSYYEEVLVVRVHPPVLANEKLPEGLVTKKIWEERCRDFRHFESHLFRNGVVVRKFFLNVSKAEQKRRFLSRLDEPEKNWKFSEADVRERGYWDQYMHAYEDMIRQTATKEAPWYVVPADNKWFTHLVVAEAIVKALEDLKLSYPKVDSAKRKALQAARTLLEKKK